MRVGHVLDVGYEAIILMYNPQIYETADVISTYVYRRGLIDADYSFAAAVGLFQSLVGMLMVMGANALSRKLTETSLW
jgi:putative aldouronate transport system permease protein